MKKPILAILATILASLACGQIVTATAPAVSTQQSATTSPPPTIGSTQPSAVSTATPWVVTVTGWAVNVRSEPRVNHNVIATLEYGQTVSVLDVKQSWFLVELSEQNKSSSGWVFRGCLSDNGGLGCEEAE